MRPGDLLQDCDLALKAQQLVSLAHSFCMVQQGPSHSKFPIPPHMQLTYATCSLIGSSSSSKSHEASTASMLGQLPWMVK